MKHVLKIKYLRNILIASSIIAIALPICVFLFIFPSFTKTLAENTEDEAVRLAHHLNTMIIGAQTELSRDSLSDAKLQLAKRYTEEFELMKLKLFSNSGEIIYSTESKEIGTINKKRYFHDIVAKGKPYTKVVKKDTPSLEGQVVALDVVETYVPIMKDAAFLGAFEIYYDITDRKAKLDKLVSISRIVLSIMALGLLSAIIIVLMKAGNNISRREQAEDALRERTESLERSNKELEQFAYVASHDLQEPLRMVASYTQLLAKRYKAQLDSDAHEFIAYAVDGATRMQVLINDLLTYSRVGTKGKDLEMTNCDTILDHTLDNLRKSIEENAAKVTRNPLPSVMADDVQLGQLFQNLISNAIKFRSDKPLHVHVWADRNENKWTISVRDNGIGIDPEYSDRIFVIFQQLHGKEEYPGTGIGLAICKKIVERHGGHIWIESEPGKGSTFHFTMPMKGENYP